MTALLDLPSVRSRVHPMSVDTYHRLAALGMVDENVELLRGIMVAKTSKSPLHELVAQKLMKHLLAQAPPGLEIRREGPLTLRDSEPEPDLSVVRGSPDDWAEAHPTTALLVVEVAVSSLELDRSKSAIYAEAGIPEYWMICPEDRAATLYRQPSPHGYLQQIAVTEAEPLSSTALPGFAVLLRDLLPAPRPQ